MQSTPADLAEAEEVSNIAQSFLPVGTLGPSSFLLCARLLGGDVRPGLDARWIRAKFIHFPNRDLSDALPFPFLPSHHSSGVLALPQPDLPHLSWDAPGHEPWLRGGFPKETWLTGLKYKLSRGMSPLFYSPEAAELGLFTKSPGYSCDLLSSSSSLAPWSTQWGSTFLLLSPKSGFPTPTDGKSFHTDSFQLQPILFSACAPPPLCYPSQFPRRVYLFLRDGMVKEEKIPFNSPGQLFGWFQHSDGQVAADGAQCLLKKPLPSPTHSFWAVRHCPLDCTYTSQKLGHWTNLG